MNQMEISEQDTFNFAQELPSPVSLDKRLDKLERNVDMLKDIGKIMVAALVGGLLVGLILVGVKWYMDRKTPATDMNPATKSEISRPQMPVNKSSSSEILHSVLSVDSTSTSKDTTSARSTK